MFTIKLKHGRRRFPELIRLGLSIIGFLIFGYICFLCDFYLDKKNDYSGKLLSKYEDRIVDDGKININRNFLIQFDSLESSRVIEVDSSTYVLKTIGDRVTLPLTNNYIHGNKFELFALILALILFGLFVSILVYLFENIRHVFVDYEIISLKKLRERKKIDPLGEEDWSD